VKTFTLTGHRVTLGRAAANELCFPEDTGLSRQHLYLEQNGTDWTVGDSGSKNGTLLNGDRLTSPRKLRPGDRILAGHLTIIYDPPSNRFNETVVFIDTQEERSTAARRLSDVLPLEGPTTPLREKTTVSGDRVAALIRAGRELAGHRPLNDLFPLILHLAIDAVHAERGVLLALESGELVVKASAGGNNFRISSGVRDRVLDEKTSILVNDVMSDEAFRGMQSLVQQQVRMLMAAPLQTNDQVIGLIYVDSPQLTREFTIEDLNLLTVMANVAAIRIEHARLTEIEQAEQLMARDLEQAAIIQQQLLPAKAPAVPGLDLAGYNAPCRTVGGDLYDFLTYPDGRVGVALGDVSGKAMPAALLMTSLQARLRVLAEDPPDVAELIERLNRQTSANCPSNCFITFVFCLLDGRSGELIYTNAGHNPPMLVRADGTVHKLDIGGTVLGLFPKSKFEAGREVLNAGDTLVLYSDGVPEAAGQKEQEFGEERLEEVLLRNRDRSSSEIVRAVTQAISTWTQGGPPADDVTLVVARRNGEYDSG
jgi:serine phosphatase RsbU (regulator of sigma subunit)